MSDFEKLLSQFFNDVEQGREGRIQHNELVFGICRSDAEMLDQITSGAVLEVGRLIGKRVDKLQGVVQAAALLRIPEVLYANMRGIGEFLNEVVIVTAIEGVPITPNPDNPSCDCENCQLARAVSTIMAQKL